MNSLVSERADTAIKALGDTGRVGGYLVVWGSPTQKDLSGEYFTPETDLGVGWYPQRPVLYHHGLDGDMQTAVIGVIDTLKTDSVGLWAEAQLDLHNRYVQAVMRLVKSGALGWSSGSLPHLVEITADGQIKRWPIVEGSLTPSPAEPRHTGVSSIKGLPHPPTFEQYVTTIKSAYSALGLDPARLLAAPENPIPTIEPMAREEAEGNEGGEVNITIEIESADTDDPPQEVKTPTMDLNALLQALLQSAQQMFPDLQVTPEQAQAIIQQATDALTAAQQQTAGGEGMASLTPDQAIAAAAPIVAKAVGELAAAKAAQAQALKTQSDEAMKRIMLASQPVSRVPAITNPTAPNAPAVKTNITEMHDERFDHLNAPEMALGILMLQRLGKTVSPDFQKAAAYKTAQLVEKGDPAANDFAVKSMFDFNKPGDVMQAQFTALKANEVMGTGQSGYGAEYVHTYYSTQVWETVRQATNLYDRMMALGMDEKEVPKGYKSDTIPLEGADMTWYVADEAADEDATSGQVAPTYNSSKFATGQKEITLAKLSARTYWSRELDEDSIVNVLAEANRKIKVSGTEQIENILYNGDTATAATTNINTIDGTPGTGKNKPSYLLLDGLAKLALVTNTAQLYNALGTLNEAVFLNLMPLLGPSGKYATDPGKILFVLDNFTYFAALNLAVLKTQDVFPTATIVDGMLKRIWGTEIVRSAQVGKANTNGKVATTTPANNTTGRIMLVRPDQWAARWKRHIEIFTDFTPRNDKTELVAHMRWGLGYRANDAVALARNVSLTIA